MGSEKNEGLRQAHSHPPALAWFKKRIELEHGECITAGSTAPAGKFQPNRDDFGLWPKSGKCSCIECGFEVDASAGRPEYCPDCGVIPFRRFISG